MWMLYNICWSQKKLPTSTAANFTWLWIMCWERIRNMPHSCSLISQIGSQFLLATTDDAVFSTFLWIRFNFSLRGVIPFVCERESRMWRHSINFDDGLIHLLRISLHYLLNLSSVLPACVLYAPSISRRRRAAAEDWRRYAIRIYSTNHEIVHLSALSQAWTCCCVAVVLLRDFGK